MPYKLPESIHSMSQLKQLQSELKRLSSLRNPKNISFSENLQELALGNRIRKLNMTIVAGLLTFVNATVLNGSEITMALASMPSEDEKDDLVGNLRRMFKKDLLVHFVIQPELLAGATIRTPRSFYDMSLRTALFSNKQKLIAGIKNG